MSTIKIDTGVKVFDIINEKGENLGQLRFNPADTNIAVRANKFKATIEQWLDDISNMKDVSEEDIIKLLEEYDNNIKCLVNDLFADENTSNIVFGSQSVFNVLNGETFIERFMKSIFPIVQEEIKKSQEESDKRVNKYTSQVSRRKLV